MAQLPAEELSTAGHAAALASWHAMHGFCGRCTTNLQHKSLLLPLLG